MIYGVELWQKCLCRWEGARGVFQGQAEWAEKQLRDLEKRKFKGVFLTVYNSLMGGWSQVGVSLCSKGTRTALA